MGSALSTYTCCTFSRKKKAICLSEKSQYTPLSHNQSDGNDKMAAKRILTILQTSASRNEVVSKVQALEKDRVFVNNWSENLAFYILDGVTAMIQKGTDMSDVMKKTYEDVKREYDAWKAENSAFARIIEISVEVALTVLALAILAVLVPS